ncbi:MAG: hypothetical protein SVK54_07430 [candidate division WOR-3 bacterium]|nr:hypothetical protein [candidate division WOR-3 bacterium]
MKKSFIIILLGILILLLFSNCWLYVPETEDIGGAADILYDGDYIAICRLSYKKNAGWVYLGEETTESVVGFVVHIIDVNTDEVYSEYLDASGLSIPYGEYTEPSYIRKSDKNIYFLSWYLLDNYKYSLENRTTLKPVKDTLFDNVENFFISSDETEVIVLEVSYFKYFNRTTGETKEFNAGQECNDVNWDLGLTAGYSSESNVYIGSFKTDSITYDVVELSISNIRRLKWLNDVLLFKDYSNNIYKIEKIDTTWQETDELEEKYYYMADDSSYINFEDGIINVYDKNDNLLKEYELEYMTQ